MEQSNLTSFESSDSSEKTSIGVTKIDYTIEEKNGKKYPIIHVFGRTNNGELKHIEVEEFYPYFYVKADEIEKEFLENENVRKIEEGFHSIDKESLVRIYTEIPADVGELRSSFNHYEADILFPDRFRIDKKIRSGIKVKERNKQPIRVDVDDIEPCDKDTQSRTMMIDIEVDDREGFPEKGEKEIICLTLWDSFEEKYYIFFWDIKKDRSLDSKKLQEIEGEIRIFDSEKKMMEEFLNFLNKKDPDILSGWNFEEFDAPYIVDRLKKLDIDIGKLSRVGEVWNKKWKGPTIKGRATFDLLYGYQRIKGSDLESYKLDSVAEEEFEDSKVEYTESIGKLWEKNPKKLLKYNKKDVELCVRLNKKKGIIDFFHELSRFAGCSIENATVPSDVVDIYILRKAHGKFVLPSKSNRKRENKYEGGEVFEPVTGIRENIIVLDLASLYPMSMMTLNASPETKVKDSYEGEVYTAPNGVKFKRQPEGLTKEIIRELLEEREEKKKNRDQYSPESDKYQKYDDQQRAVKVTMNSLYGVVGYQRFRLYDSEMGSAITATGRKIIEHTRDVIEDMNYKVIYGDTDSTLVEIGSDKKIEEIIDIGKKLEKKINISYDNFAQEFNAEDHYWKIEFEKIYRYFFQAGKKKRYAGKIVWKEGEKTDEIDITGFEHQRTDVAKITKDVQEKIVKKIIEGQSFEEISGYLREIVQKYKQGEYSYNYIGIPSGIGKKLDSYENETAHVKGAKYANKYLKTNFGKGSKPKRLYIDKTQEGYPPTEVVCFEYEEEIPDGFEIDLEKMLKKTIEKPISRILKGAGWSWTEVITGQRQKGLSSFD